MFENMVFTSKRGKQIVFDDFVWEDAEESGYDERSVWCCVCRSCHRKYRKILDGRCERDGQSLCSVKGCNNEASYYVDFYATDNIKIIMEEE